MRRKRSACCAWIPAFEPVSKKRAKPLRGGLTTCLDPIDLNDIHWVVAVRQPYAPIANEDAKLVHTINVQEWSNYLVAQ